MPRTIVITGAAAGIGRQAAHQFAACGFTVCATDLDAAGLDSLKGELGARHTLAVLDVTDKDAVARVFADFAGAHGRSFDRLVNNAGVTFLENFEELPLERHELVVDVNVNGV